MAGDATTIARPYAEAVFARAVETDKLDLWSEMLGFLAAVTEEADLADLITSPKLDQTQMTDLMLEIAGGNINDEGQNLVKLLVQNDRLLVVSDIASHYETRKSEHLSTLDVEIVSAYAVNAADQKKLAKALTAKLGREVRITSEKDPELIGGIKIRAGDLVIDGSVSGQLTQLANELGI